MSQHSRIDPFNHLNPTMKTFFFLSLFLSPFLACAQGSQQRNFPHKSNSHVKAQPAHCPRIYLGVGTGINGNSGLLGINADISIIDAVSVSAGVGLSSWGNK